MADELDFSGALDRVLQQQATGAPAAAPAIPTTPLAPTTDLLTGAAPTPSPFAAALDQVIRGDIAPPAPAAAPAPTAPDTAAPAPEPALGSEDTARAAQEAASGVAAANGLLSEGVRPEVVAEIRRISRDQGIPLPLAAQTYIERARAAPGARYRALLQQNPGLRRIANQGSAYADFMADAAELATVENAFNAGRAFGVTGARTLTSTLLSGAAELNDIAGRAILNSILSVLPEETAEGIRAADAQLAEAISAAEDRLGVPLTPSNILRDPATILDEMYDAVDVPQEDRNVVTDIGSALGQFGGQMVLYFLSGGTAAVGGTLLMSVDEQTQRVQQADAYGTVQGDIGVLGAAGVNALLDQYNLGIIFEKLPPRMRNRALRILASGTSEGVTEFLQATSANLIALGVYDPNTGVFDDAAYEGFLGGVVGAVAGAIIPGRPRGAGPDALPPEINDLLSPDALQSAADQAAAAQQALEVTRAAIEETATFARDPEAVRELLVAAGDQEVSIPVQEIERLYQEGALTDDDIAYLNVEDELTQQGELSGDVVTTASRVLTLQGDAFSRLSEHIRTQPGAPTAAEARANLANREADIARLQGVLEQAQNVAGEINTLADTIADQLRTTTNLSRGQARAAGRLLAERYAARAALFEPGTTAQSLYDRDRVTFETEGRAAPAPDLEQAEAAVSPLVLDQAEAALTAVVDQPAPLPQEPALISALTNAGVPVSADGRVELTDVEAAMAVLTDLRSVPTVLEQVPLDAVQRLDIRAPVRAPRGATYMGVGPQYTVENPNTEAPALQRNAPLIQASTNAGNADAQSAALDALFERHPDPLASEEAWVNLANDAFSLDRVPMPPFRTIEIVQQGPEAIAQEISQLSAGMRRDAEAGLETAREFGEVYSSGQATPDITAKAFLWSFLSRGVSPYVQEAAFLDAIVSDRLTSIMQRATADGWSDALEAEYNEWAASAIPPGSPGRGTQHNLNAFGRNFMRVMTQRHDDAGGRTGLEIIHEMIADGIPSYLIRREFLKRGSGAGIDNKVVSFTLLLLGRSDVLVLDRVQVRNQWNDGRFDGQNIYDADKDADGKQVTGSAFAEMTFGHKGLLYYEAMERTLQPLIEEAYASLGIEGSLGRYHWDSWLLASNQEVGHASVEGLLRDAQRREMPYAGAFVRQGKYANYDYGFRYGVLPDGQLSTIVERLDGTGATVVPYEVMADPKHPARKVLSRLSTAAKKRGSQYGSVQPWTAALTTDERSTYDEAIASAGSPAPDIWQYDPNAIRRADDAGGERTFDQPGINAGEGLRRTSGGPVTLAGRDTTSTAVFGADTDRPVYEVSDPELFRDLINEAKVALGPLGAQVTAYDDYAGKRLFLFDDGASGFALDGDDIISVFSMPGQAPQGAAQRVLELAVTEGGRRLDAFDTFLPKLYARNGFRAVASLGFNREFAPPGWDYDFFSEAFPQTNGEPAVVFMVYDPANAAPSTDVIIDDYDVGMQLQADALAEISAPPALEQPTQGPQTPQKGTVGAPRGSYRLPTTDDPRNLIRLSANADPSTFVHEVGHMFLFQMLRDIADPRITPEGKAQLEAQIAATRAWFSSNAAQGLTDLKALAKSMSKRAAAAPDDTELQLRASRLNAAVQRAEAGDGDAYMEHVAQAFMDPAAPGRDEAAEVVYHELWARGFERYLGTGSAPSAELRGVFAKFAQYISNVYKSLRRLNVTVSPEVADVFDRLLATEEAITQERRGAMYQLSPGVLEGATPAEANQLRRLAAEAEEQARTEMASRVENSLKAEERTKRRARREQIANEISEQIVAEPIYAAINIAKRGVMPDGTKTGTGKIDRAELVAVAGEEAVARMPAGMVSGRVRPDNAIPLGDLATLSGFPDIYTMIEALTNPTPTPEATAVKERTEAAMLQEFGADLDAGALQTKAVEVVQNDKFQQLQQLQLRILRRLAAQPMARIAQRQAEQEGAPAAAVDRAATEAAQAEQAAARTPREGIQASLARIRADVQRTANASQRRAQVAARRQTASIRLGMDPAAITAAAQRYVRTIKVKDATPARYRQAAARLTAKIERAIADRDYTQAATLMEQRALNLAVAKEASIVQTKIEAQRTRWREVTARSDKRLAQRYSIDWINAIRVVLEPFGMARNMPRNYDPARALADLQAVEPTLYTEIQLAISTYAARSQAAAQANPNNPYKDLSVQEALDLLETADTMLANARDSHGVLIEGRRIEFGTIADEVAVNVGQRRKVQKQAGRIGRGRGSRTFRETRRQLGAFKASLRRIEQWARDFDNGNPRGPLTRYLVRPVMAAVDAYTVARKGPQEALAALLRNRTDLMARRPIRAPELDGYVFQTKGELIMALLHTGNDSNKRKLLLGGATDVETNRRYVWGSQDADGNLDTSRWDTFVDRLFADGTLTQADMELVQGIWDIFEQTKKAAQAAHKQMYGYYFAEVQADPVVTPFGIYPGGYAPAITDSMMNPDGARFEAEEVMSQQSNASMFPGAEKGFTQSRVEYNQPLDLDLTRIPAHFDRVMKFAYLGPAVRQAARLVTNRAFREAVRPGSPDVIDVAVIPWLQRTVQQRVTTPPTNQGWSGLSRVAAAIDRRVGLHIMAGNMVNAAQQITGFSVAAARIPARHLAVAATRWRVNTQSARAYIIAQSPFMEDRLTGGMNEASTTLENILTEPGLLNRARNAAQQYGYFAQQIAQNLVDPTVWLAAERHGMEVVYPAAYADALARTGDEAAADTAARAEVIAYADSVVRDTQAPLRPSDVSGIEASSPLARLFLKFYSYFNAMGNLLVTEKNVAMNSDMGWAGRYGRSFYAYLMIVTIPTIVAESIAQLARSGFDDLEDEDERDQLMFELLIGSQLKTLAAMVPFAGSVVSTAYGIAVTDQIYDDRISLSAGIGVTESTLQGVIRLIAAAADPNTDVETQRAIKTTLDAMGLALGLPVNWASKPISYAISVNEGDSRPEGLVDLIQGALTGRDGTDR